MTLSKVPCSSVSSPPNLAILPCLGVITTISPHDQKTENIYFLSYWAQSLSPMGVSSNNTMKPRLAQYECGPGLFSPISWLPPSSGKARFVEEEEMATATEGGDDDAISFAVKFGGKSIPVTTSCNSTVRDLKTLLQPLTDVLPRGQKLIFKGKVLADAATLKAFGLMSGAKVMLMASQGLHQGEGPILKPAQAQPFRRADINESSKVKNDKGVVAIEKIRCDRWKVTGVVALAECNLKTIPDEVWTCGSSARILDISNNCIESIPQQISSLTSLQKLLMTANGISEQSVSWEGLSSLRLLTVLSLSQNHFKSLPSAASVLRSLRQLDISCNQLTALPVEIGHLNQLEVLKANNNRISTIPPSIGDCNSLIEVDFSSNLLTGLPETMGNLHNLKVLILGNNGLISFPSTLFRGCIHLSTLDLHNTEITIDVLRQIEGWESFDERRRLKHQKQLDFRVVSSAEFHESADKS